MGNKKYTEVFKSNAVAMLREIQIGVCKIGDKYIGNVRDLCKYLELSTHTIYTWNKQIKTAKRIILENDISADIEGIKINIFGIRFYGWFARNLGIKDYGKMDLKQLRLAIADKLIKEAK